MKRNKHKSSFRDPSGFIFWDDNVLYRQINRCYASDYDLLIKSGLYQELVEKDLLIPHKEVKIPGILDSDCYKIIKPNIVPFISYPYEWPFGMLKDAALATLEIQKTALEKDMVLKDASAYNIQFVNNKPVFIDTLSFEKYEQGTPWVAYQQFCKHFLAPLSLMSYVDIDFGKFSQLYIDGIPLSFASKLLPVKAKLNPGLFMHIFLHAQSQNKHSQDGMKSTKKIENKKGISKYALLGIIDNLSNTIKQLKWNLPKTEWGDYYSITNYTDKAMEKKNKQVEDLLLKTKPNIVWDLGANTGRFSRLASRHTIFTIAFDIDPVAVEIGYQRSKEVNEKYLLTLIQDLTNPSSAIGFENSERDALMQRGPADTVLALALIHHMAISNNLPFERLAEFFAKCGKYLIIEFVPKCDSQVQILLFSRKDIFPNYNIDDFKKTFGRVFDILEEKKIPNTQRVLFLMKRRKDFDAR